MLNTKLLTYNIKIPLELRQMVYRMKYKDSLSVCVVLTNLASGVRKGTSIVYSREKNKAHNGKRKLTTRKIIQAIEFLESKGLLLNFPGKGHVDPKKREISYIQPTEKFMNTFLTIADFKQIEQDYLDAVEGVILRDADKIAKNYIKTEETEKMKDLVLRLNKLNEQSTILTGDGYRLSNIYSRIFNETFSQGGRFYKADILQLHTRDGNQRLDITIDGKPVVEIDFQNLHFRIAAVIEGMDMQDIPMDMYADILEDVTNKIDRRIVKLAVNIMFNCKSVESAKRAIQGEINSLSVEDKEKYTLGNAKSVMALIEMNYSDFSEMFCNEDSFGRVLQNLDSHLAADVLEVFVQKGIPILCVHDSFVVAKENLELLAVTMADKFRERFKTDCSVPMSIKWKDSDTNVVEKKIVL